MITEFGRMYGALVMMNKRALSEEANPNLLPVVPEKYRDEAAEYIDYIISHGHEEKSARLSEREAILEENNMIFNDLLLGVLGGDMDIDNN